jgi:hypothetical protein
VYMSEHVEQMRNAYKSFSRKTLKEGHFERLERRWEDNIRMNLWEIV